MTIYIEDNLPNIRDNGLNTLEDTSVGGNLAVTGTSAFTGVATFTAAPVFNGGQTATTVVQSALVGATVALTAAQSGGVFINRSTSGTPSWTLPTNVAGLRYTFVTANTTAGYTVTGGTIKAKTNAAGTAISGTTLTNTQATAVVGDAITLVADGTNWVMVSQTGVFGAA
ncbi:MAG: hypothetical protein IPP74_14590 [Alphaproteobacteria bacterium]|nr:hypothetical protein [Alphaproteobacteria bacterium]